ncbi:EAL domain-containing protein, partial [Enterocloster bolteae]|uniref:EAL domain-containing protein n=1 Tax=Enterocloster bolteae TaxID=208479 RepID=UPI002108B386
RSSIRDLSSFTSSNFMMDDLAANRTNQTVVKCIIDMCHSLQVECVAEGVENQEQLELLTSFGYTAIQGYYYSKPLEIEEFEKI